jgi:hypothetical protein
MQRALLFDLLVRALVAVEQGLSHRKAGERFEVGAASISPWRALERKVRARSQGGDRRSGHVEALRDTIFALIRRNARHRDRGIATGARRQRRNGSLRHHPALLHRPPHHAQNVWPARSHSAALR